MKFQIWPKLQFIFGCFWKFLAWDLAEGPKGPKKEAQRAPRRAPKFLVHNIILIKLYLCLYNYFIKTFYYIFRHHLYQNQCNIGMPILELEQGENISHSWETSIHITQSYYDLPHILTQYYIQMWIFTYI